MKLGLDLSKCRDAKNVLVQNLRDLVGSRFPDDPPDEHIFQVDVLYTGTRPKSTGGHGANRLPSLPSDTPSEHESPRSPSVHFSDIPVLVKKKVRNSKKNPKYTPHHSGETSDEDIGLLNHQNGHLPGSFRSSISSLITGPVGYNKPPTGTSMADPYRNRGTVKTKTKNHPKPLYHGGQQSDPHRHESHHTEQSHRNSQHVQNRQHDHQTLHNQQGQHYNHRGVHCPPENSYDHWQHSHGNAPPPQRSHYGGNPYLHGHYTSHTPHYNPYYQESSGYFPFPPPHHYRQNTPPACQLECCNPAPQSPAQCDLPCCNNGYRDRSGTAMYSPNLRFTGASIAPLRTTDHPGASGVRRKILSGKYSNTSQEVRSQQAWPHVMLDRAYCAEVPEYADLTWPQFFAGMTSKILGEISVRAIGTHTENQLKHLNRISEYACNTSRSSMLDFNSAVFQAIEHGHLSWNNWPQIHAFHEKHLDSLRLQAHNSGDQKGGKSEKSAKKSTFVSTDYMRSQGICFKFQNAVCDEEGSHILAGTNNTVLHICGLCHLLNKENVPDHGYQACPKKQE